MKISLLEFLHRLMTCFIVVAVAVESAMLLRRGVAFRFSKRIFIRSGFLTEDASKWNTFIIPNDSLFTNECSGFHGRGWRCWKPKSCFPFSEWSMHLTGGICERAMDERACVWGCGNSRARLKSSGSYRTHLCEIYWLKGWEHHNVLCALTQGFGLNDYTSLVLVKDGLVFPSQPSALNRFNGFVRVQTLEFPPSCKIWISQGFLKLIFRP